MPRWFRSVDLAAHGRRNQLKDLSPSHGYSAVYRKCRLIRRAGGPGGLGRECMGPLNVSDSVVSGK